MAYIPKPNTGSLFKNDRATEDNGQPAYRGDCVLEGGTLLEIGAWLNKTKDGRTYMSLKFQPPRPKEAQYNVPAPPDVKARNLKSPDPTASQPDDFGDDDIPF